MDVNQGNILAELTRLLRRLCQDATLELAIDTPLDAIGGVDSLRLLQAVAHLEEYFHVEIDVVAVDEMERVRDIVNAIAAARPQQCDVAGKPVCT